MKRVLANLALTLSLAAFGSPAQADAPLDGDGWVTWRVAAAPGIPDWCCYRWSAGEGRRETCDLLDDGPHIGSTGDTQGRTGELQLWAHVASGTMDRLVALSPDCPVKRNVTWRDLGTIPASQSLDWIENGGAMNASQAMAVFASHAGTDSVRRLEAIALDGADRHERKDAIFWLAQLRVEESRDTLTTLMSLEDDRVIRDHAIFSFAQSSAPDRYDVLIDVIEDRHQPLEGRKQALFWLAQAEDGQGVDYIQALLRDD